MAATMPPRPGFLQTPSPYETREVRMLHKSGEFYLDLPEALVDFVIEAMLPELADYDVDVR